MDRENHPIDVAVIVVNYHEDRAAIAAVEQFTALLDDAGFTVHGIVCDNSKTIAHEGDTSYTVIKLANPGYAAAINIGISSVDAELYLLCSHEVQWIAGDIRKLVKAARTPNVAAAAPVLVDDATGAVLSGGKRLSRGLPVHITDGLASEPYSVEALDGACWMIPAAAWADVGLLDESYFLYWEESDWHARARRAGYDIICVPEIRVRASAGTQPASVYYLYRNRYRYTATHISRRRAFTMAMSEILFRLPGASARRLLVPNSPRPFTRYRWRAVRDWLLHKTGPADLG